MSATCQECGAMLPAQNPRYPRRRRFCDARCQSRHWHAKNPRGGRLRACASCGCPFLAVNADHRFCGRPCVRLPMRGLGAPPPSRIRPRITPVDLLDIADYARVEACRWGMPEMPMRPAAPANRQQPMQPRPGELLPCYWPLAERRMWPPVPR